VTPFGSSPKNTAIEVHASTSSSFTPSSATLRGIAESGRFDLSGETPGTALYVRTVAVDRQGRRSAPSPAVAVTPAYVTGVVVDPVLRLREKCVLTSAQSVSGEGTVKVGIDAYLFRFGDMLDPTNKRILIPTGGAGLWRINAQTLMASVDSSSTVGHLEAKKNGTTVIARGPIAYAAPDATADTAVTLVCVLDQTVSLADGDYVEIDLVTKNLTSGKSISADTASTYVEVTRLMQ
jgi:hypothetical protein